MPSDTASSAAMDGIGDSRVAVIAALAAELAPFRASVPEERAIFRQCGPGKEHASAAAKAAISEGVRGLISWGYAGGLNPELEAGTLIVPAAILTRDGRLYETDTKWRENLLNALGDLGSSSGARLLSSDRVLVSAIEKRRAFDETGAAAVDMESAAIVSAANSAGLPCVVLRFVFDAAKDSLPRDADRWIDSGGNQRLAPLGAALLSPRQWPILWNLARRKSLVHRRLDKVADVLASSGYYFPRGRIAAR